MYPFALCKKAEKHPGKQGQFMIGVKKVAESEVAVLMDMLGDLPMTHIFQEDGLYLDGVVQGIRAFGDTPKAVSKEVFYRDAAKINGLSTKQRECFENFHKVVAYFINSFQIFLFDFVLIGIENLYANKIFGIEHFLIFVISQRC